MSCISSSMSKTSLDLAYHYLIDHIYICVGRFSGRRLAGTDCAPPFIANLYLSACESAYLAIEPRLIKTARKFSNSFHYPDDLLTINNNNLVLELPHDIYSTD